MSYQLSDGQMNWIKSIKDSPDRMSLLHAFMAKGPAEVLQLMDMKTREFSFQASVRGIRVGESTQDSQEVWTRANDRLAELQAMDLPVLDEVALGISDHNWRTFDRCYEATVHTETILHIGGMAGSGFDVNSDGIEGFLDRCFDKHPPAALSAFPGLLKEMRRGKKEEGRGGALLAFSEYTAERSLYGFLVQVATPVFKYTSEDSASFSWGLCNTEWFYGETFEEAIAKGVTWAEETHEEAKEKWRQAQGQKAVV